MCLANLDFVVERHRIWELRQAGSPAPWTEDPILAGKKFTCVFRLLDHGSQFLLPMLQEELPPRDRLMRAFLYRHTGRPEPWEFFELMHGRYPLVGDLDLALETWTAYRGKTNVGHRGAGDRFRAGPANTFDRPLFTAAYLVFPQTIVPGTDKVTTIIDLASRLFTEGSPQDIVPRFLAARTQADRFHVLRSNPGVGDFMSMQILTDWGYTTDDRENEFVVAGPGAVKGAKLLFPTRKPLDVIRWARAQLLGLPDCPRLGTREPSPMDIQNTLCEFSKYARYMGQPHQQYHPAHQGAQPKPTLPVHW